MMTASYSEQWSGDQCSPDENCHETHEAVRNIQECSVVCSLNLLDSFSCSLNAYSSTFTPAIASEGGGVAQNSRRRAAPSQDRLLRPSSPRFAGNTGVPDKFTVHVPLTRTQTSCGCEVQRSGVTLEFTHQI